MPVPRSVAMAAGASFALLAYGAVQLAFTPGAERWETSIVEARSASARSDTPAEPTPVVQVRTGLRGDEAFIGGSLRIPIQARGTTGSPLFPPPPPAVETAALTPTAPATQSDPPVRKHAAPVVAIA
jgi:hypothetical protein